MKPPKPLPSKQQAKKRRKPVPKRGGKTFWDGEPADCKRGTAIIARPPGVHPTWWTEVQGLTGTARRVVRVQKDNRIFYIDDQDGSGWRKVTNGRGSWQFGHRSLYIRPDSFIPLKDA